jgi:branched-chain amino acid transport system substrate-binding protein
MFALRMEPRAPMTGELSGRGCEGCKEKCMKPDNQKKEIAMKKALAFVMVYFVGMAFMIAAQTGTGVTDTEIIVGSQTDIGGPHAAWGIQAKKGLEMRANEINAAGGIHGRKIKLIVEDHQSDPKKAVLLTNKMILRDHVFCFVYNMGSATGLSTLPIVTRKKIPFLFPLSAHNGFYEPLNRYSFQESPPYQMQAGVATLYIVEKLGAKRVGLLYQDDEFGALVMQGVKDQLAKYGMNLTAAESYKSGSTDFSTQIAKLMKAEVDFLILGTVIRETVGAVKEAKKIGWDVPMITMASAVTKYVPFLASTAGVSVDGLYSASHTPYVFNSKDPKVMAWAARYEEIYGEKPDQPVAHGYEAMEWLAIAIERCGKNLTRERLIQELEKFDGVPGALNSQPLHFSPTNHLGATGAFITVFRNGTFEKITDFIYLDK